MGTLRPALEVGGEGHDARCRARPRPGAPAPTATGAAAGAPASSHQRPQRGRDAREQRRGADARGRGDDPWASRSPRRSATARRVRVGPRSMPATKPWRALNSMKDGPAAAARRARAQVAHHAAADEVGGEAAHGGRRQAGGLDQLRPREGAGPVHGDVQHALEVQSAQVRGVPRSAVRARPRGLPGRHCKRSLDANYVKESKKVLRNAARPRINLRRRRGSTRPRSAPGGLACGIRPFDALGRCRSPRSPRPLPRGEARRAAPAGRPAGALQSSAQVPAEGRRRLHRGFATDGWHAVTVPNTVVGALVENGTYPDPYFGMNLRKIPGTTYQIGEHFTLIPTPADSPFKPRRGGTARSSTLPAGHGRPRRLAALRRHQLPREHLVQRPRSRRRATRWRAPSAATSSTSRGWRGRARRNAVAVEVFGPEPHDLADHLGRLEPHAAGQEHGPLGRRLPDGQRPARAAPTRTWSRKLDLPSLDARPAHRHRGGR